MKARVRLRDGVTSSISTQDVMHARFHGLLRLPFGVASLWHLLFPK